MSLGKKILQNAGFRTAYKVPANKKSTVNLLVNAQAASDFKVVVTDIASSPEDLNLTNTRQDFSATVGNNHLGYSVSIDGDYAVVGAPSSGGVVGFIQIYFFDGTSWSLQQTITDPANDIDAQFGFAVAIDDTNIVVGAPADDQTEPSDSGRAYRYSRSGTVWSLVDTYISPAGANSFFGDAVAIAGDYVLIGASQFDIGGVTNTGRAYGYRVSAGAALQVTYTNPNNGNNDRFGWSVAVWDNGSAVIGSFGFSAGANTGRAYYYASFSNSVNGTITNPNNANNDRFGFTVACDKTGTFFAVGSEVFNGGNATGRVYTYSRTAPTTVLQTIGAPDTQTSQFFGTGLSMSTSGGLLVGAYRFDASGINDQGIAYYYTRSGNTWTLNETIANPFPAAFDYFGFGVALREIPDQDSARYVIGAYFDDTLAIDAGSVYFYNKGFFADGPQVLALEADQITDQVSLAAGDTFERTGIVVDEGESIVVLSRTELPDLRITVRGFEEDI